MQQARHRRGSTSVIATMWTLSRVMNDDVVAETTIRVAKRGETRRRDQPIVNASTPNFHGDRK